MRAAVKPKRRFSDKFERGMDVKGRGMDARQFGVSRHTLVLGAAVFATLITLGIGANAALNKANAALNLVNPEQSPAVSAAAPGGDIVARPNRFALVIGNSRYPDANAPLAHPVNDARTLSTALRNDGFDVEALENATRSDIVRAVARLKAKLRPDAVVMLFFGGYAVQSAGESFMIPVDAAIWREADVRREGVALEWVLSEVQDSGAHAKLVVIDASRRNPYERRFRAFSRGLAPITAPENALILSSAGPDKVLEDESGEHSRLVTELLDNMNSSAGTAERVFERTRVNIAQATDGHQVPAMSSSLTDDIRLGSGPAHLSDSGS